MAGETRVLRTANDNKEHQMDILPKDNEELFQCHQAPWSPLSIEGDSVEEKGIPEIQEEPDVEIEDIWNSSGPEESMLHLQEVCTTSPLWDTAHPEVTQ